MNQESKRHCAIVLMGPPAAGKGTIATVLSEKFGFEIITPGSIYREIREQTGELAELVRESLKDGGLCPDWLTNKLMLEEADKRKEKRLIFDGFPRSNEQFSMLQESFNVGAYLHLDAPYQLLEIFATNRIQCVSCKAVMSLTNANTWCDCLRQQIPDDFLENPSATIPEGLWTTRHDDTPEIFAKRYKVYMEQTMPVIEKVRDLENYGKFQTLGDPDGVSKVTAWLEQLGVVSKQVI